MKRIIQALKAAWSASFTDQYVDRCGAEKIETIPVDAAHIDTPVLIWVGNYSVKNQSKVYLKADHLIISEKNKDNPIQIELDAIQVAESGNPRSFSDRQRPFLLKGIQVGFGGTTDNLILTQKSKPNKSAQVNPCNPPENPRIT